MLALGQQLQYKHITTIFLKSFIRIGFNFVVADANQEILFYRSRMRLDIGDSRLQKSVKVS